MLTRPHSVTAQCQQLGIVEPLSDNGATHTRTRCGSMCKQLQVSSSSRTRLYRNIPHTHLPKYPHTHTSVLLLEASLQTPLHKRANCAKICGTHDLPLTSTEVPTLTAVPRIHEYISCREEKKKRTLHTVAPRTWAHTVALRRTDTEAPPHTARALPSVAPPHIAPAPKTEKKNANTVTKVIGGADILYTCYRLWCRHELRL